MRATILKVGDKAKGFKFDTMIYGDYWVYWNDIKEEYIGKVGVVDTIINDSEFTIYFGDAVISYPTPLMHLAVVEDEPKVIEIDMSKVEKIEYYYNGKWQVADVFDDKYRFTFKDENKIKIHKEIEDLENRINELKKQL